MEQPERPPGDDPYRAVWNMTPVGGVEGRQRSELRWVPGLIAAFVVFMPFGVLASWLWGWWDGGGTAAGGWVVTLLGLAGAFSLGAFVASDRS
jgi:hypothetical protein